MLDKVVGERLYPAAKAFLEAEMRYRHAEIEMGAHNEKQPEEQSAFAEIAQYEEYRVLYNAWNKTREDLWQIVLDARSTYYDQYT